MNGGVLGTATDAAVGQFQEAAERHAGLVDDEGLLDAHFALGELVLNDCVALVVRVG